MPKFFVSPDAIFDKTAHLTGEDVAHITRVLRLGVGDEVLLSDGKGTDYDAQIAQIDKKEVHCSILAARPCEAEPPLEVILYQALPKASKMDYIIQKTVELGVSRIVPVETKFCVAKAKDGKTERFSRIALEAAKQCGRGIIPSVKEAVSFDEAIEELSKCDLSIMAYEGEREGRLKDVLSRKGKTIGLLIGSEGGFAPEEVESAKAKGISVITMGRRILRTETAGAALLAAVMYELGDW